MIYCSFCNWKKDALIPIILVKQQISRYESNKPQKAADLNWMTVLCLR